MPCRRAVRLDAEVDKLAENEQRSEPDAARASARVRTPARRLQPGATERDCKESKIVLDNNNSEAVKRGFGLHLRWLEAADRMLFR